MKEFLKVFKIRLVSRITKDLRYITPEEFLIFSVFDLLLILKICR